LLYYMLPCHGEIKLIKSSSTRGLLPRTDIDRT